MSVYNVNGNSLASVYNVNGISLSHAYNINGIDVFSGDDDYNVWTTEYEHAILQARDEWKKQYIFCGCSY